ncbi:YwiC-like family protein [Enemella evansiae]|uniref:YwiC-like family protein n=1 Tax=Enemella evansiae TaxID=2016499 RepID=UPI00117E5D08|nr:YwiC-like family protein [Enemella evansiae]
MSTSLPRPALVAVSQRPGGHTERWLPDHPGAWLMLLSPALIAAVAAISEQGDAPSHLWPMLLCWVFARCAYSAAAPLLAERQAGGPVALIERHAWWRPRPVLVWATLAAICGCLAVAESGWRLLGWIGVYLPLTALALWLSAQGRHRGALTGMLSVAAACLVPLTLLHPDPAHLALAAGGAGLTLVSLAYLCGAALHLRALTPHRTLTRRRLVSVGWHALVTAIAVVAAAAGGSGAPWAVFFGLTMLRALLVPLLGPALGRTVTPRVVLGAEAVLAVGFCGLAISSLAAITLS